MSADYEKTITLGQEADKLKTRGEYDVALVKYKQAWESMPSDKTSFQFWNGWLQYFLVHMNKNDA